MVEPFPAWPLSEEQPCAMGGRGARQGAGRHTDSESDEGAGTMAMPRDGECPMPHGRCFSAPLMPQLRQAPRPRTTQELLTAPAGPHGAWMSVETRGTVCRDARRVPSASPHRAARQGIVRTLLHHLTAPCRFCAPRRVRSPRSPLHIEVGIMEAGDA